MLLRLVHGFSTGFQPTGTSAYVADISPLERRGEAIGLHGLAGSLGMAGGPALGGSLAAYYSLNTVFYCSSVLALLSALVLIGLPETIRQQQPFRLRLLKVSGRELVEPRVFSPALIMLLTMFSYGIVLTITPDFSAHLGIKNKGLFFSCFTVASLATRLLAGRASDKYGRVTVLKVSTLVLVIAMLCVGFADSPVTLLGAAALYGIAQGLNSPTLYAWTVDLSDPNHRGRAMSTTYIALEIGIGSSAVLAAWLYGNNADRFPLVFCLGAALALVAFGYVLLTKPRSTYETQNN